MKYKHSIFKNLLLLSGTILLFSTCKKYPENKLPLLIVPPEKRLEHLVGAKLVEYKRDGVSLMDSINTIYKEIKISSYRFHIKSLEDYYCPYMHIDSIRWDNKNSSSFFQVCFSNDKKFMNGKKVLKLTKKELKRTWEYKNHIYEEHYKK